MTATKKNPPKTRERELTLEDAISEAFGELTTLGEEMREAFDNTPESLQSSGVGERRGEAADALENLQEPDVPEELKGDAFKMNWQVHVLSPSAERRKSRAMRRDEAVETLQNVVGYLNDDIEANEEKYSEAIREAASSLADDVENLINEAEEIEFPGMRG
jgi:hypothetical protein